MSSMGHKHATRWGFGDMLWHKMTGEKGMVTGIILRQHSPPLYALVFTGDISEKNCYEMELTEEHSTAVTNEK